MTPSYTSPEIKQGKQKINLFKSDIYAFGILCCLIIQGIDDKNFASKLSGLSGISDKDVYDMMVEKILAEMNKKNKLEIEINETIRGMLSYDDNVRFTIEQVEKGFEKKIPIIQAISSSQMSMGN